ncbi:MAG TPA: UvrD-helicase domain-containing protein [bacterium]|nr:UvrD-helicase domain-containing protein [bacterium]
MLADELRPEAARIHGELRARADDRTRRRLDEALLGCDTAVRAEAVLRLIATLNAEQLAAVLHDHEQDGPLLILAGAGSGKTAVLTRRVVYLLLRGAAPSALLVATFTNRAADEMRERVRELLAGLAALLPPGGAELLAPLRVAAPDLWLGTFHHVCLKLLRDRLPGEGQCNSERCGYPAEFRIMEPPQAQAMLEQAILLAGPAAGAHDAAAIRDGIERAGSELHDAAALQADGTAAEARAVGAVLARYQEQKRARQLLDFNDIITLTVGLLQRDAAVAGHYRARFRHVLIDEYQDTNFAQYVLARQLTRATDHLFVVGDDDQSIYGWRGADIRNLLQFREDYPQARVLTLVKNYRSSRTIISAANRVFDRYKPAALRKELEAVRTGADGRVVAGEKITEFLADDETDEAAFVVFAIRRALHDGRQPGDCVVLYRLNEQAGPFKTALAAAGMPYLEYGDQRFFALREIQHTVSWLQLAGLVARVRQGGCGMALPDPALADAQLAELLAVPACGMGDNDCAVLRATGGVWRVLADGEQYAALMARLTPGGRAALDRFIDGVERGSELLTADELPAACELLWQQLGYAAQAARGEQCDRRLARNLDQFRDLLRAWRERMAGSSGGAAGLADFLADLEEKRRDPQARLAAGGDAVLLMTLHAAKGLEFPVVFITGLEDGLCPLAHHTDCELDATERAQRFGEELRLFYVGMTRAQLQLHLTHARMRTRNGRSRAAEPSPFLRLLPASTVRRASSRGGFLERMRACWCGGRKP